MIEFEESHMTFRFPGEDLYHIEKSPLVQGVEGFAVCECVARLGDKVYFIEAKSSSPRPNGKVRFNEFVAEITKKFADSLSVYHAVLARHDDEPVPEGLRSINMRDADYQLYLIVYGHQPEWLVPLSDALKSQLRHVLKVWNVKDVAVKVINEKIAKQKGLISDFEHK